MQYFNRFFIFALPAAFAVSAYAFQIQYALDGDSIQGGNGEQARLLCIDAPELYQQHGAIAKKALQRLLQRGKLTIQQRGKDKHNRHLLLLTDANGRSINQTLVRNGHAWVSRRYARTCGLPPRDLFAAEQQARREKLGLWRETAPQPPWEWRKDNPRHD